MNPKEKTQEAPMEVEESAKVEEVKSKKKSREESSEKENKSAAELLKEENERLKAELAKEKEDKIPKGNGVVLDDDGNIEEAVKGDVFVKVNIKRNGQIYRAGKSYKLSKGETELFEEKGWI